MQSMALKDHVQNSFLHYESWNQKATENNCLTSFGSITLGSSIFIVDGHMCISLNAMKEPWVLNFSC